VALPDGRVLIADTGNGRIRSVATTGQITTVEGGLYQTVTGTGPAALTGPMRAPTALAVAGDGTVFVVDNQDGRIRTFQAFSPRATTDISAPPGAWSSAAESVSKALRGPAGVAVWPAGGTAGLLATDASGSRIHVVRPDGLVGVLAVLPPGPP
jgi:serine/threonine-protein kinase